MKYSAKSIRGIKFSNNIIKVCHYADDIILFFSGKDSIAAIFSSMKVFAHCSNFKINVNKTQIMAVGVKPELQPPNIVLLSKIEILGIIYSYNQDVININLDKLINKICSNIKCWYSRSLTLYGRIVLVKSLVCSTLRMLVTFL